MKTSKTIVQGLRWAAGQSHGNHQKAARLLHALAYVLEKRKRGDLTVQEINSIDAARHVLATIIKADAIVKTVQLTHQGKENK
jgi:hypothetical protein